ncbi:acid protease [Diplodia corticola]|uniref:Acid protease n=1 Tax=Diplodia corticola TaxID=236234 RepID=A0A1J9R1M5_9PEZI|nr:acid protease [Diplodia corticola]OJD34146.1 acid protease [Diplodia corticola]
MHVTGKHSIAKRETEPAPVVVQSSQEWDGIDGPWSSFVLQVGTPAQQVRVDISIEGQETWVVAPTGCSGSTSDCAKQRGGVFDSADSSTWQSTTTIWNNSGIYELSGLITESLGIDGNGEYGFDTVGLSFGGESGPALDHTIVATFNTTDFYIGQFGASPNPTYFTVSNDNSSALDDPQESFLSMLKRTGRVPSLSYSFTAGSYARRNTIKNALGSFIFGGYDASLKGPADLSFDFAPNQGRELVVGIQSITASSQNNGTVDLLPESVFAALDSSQPNIWLPLAACQKFESAFNLTWNATAEQYLVDSTLHDRLATENPNITFRLGNGGSGGPTTDIVLPYSAFDLTMTNSTSDAQPYFPLKRAANDTQVSLSTSNHQH